MGSHAARPVDLLAKPRVTGRCEASRRSDGKATTLRSSRADLAVFRACHAFGTSLRRWGCAGRSYPSHSTSRSPPTCGSEAHGASKSRPPNLKLASVAYWYGHAVCADRSRQIRRIADCKRASGCPNVTLGTGARIVALPGPDPRTPAQRNPSPMGLKDHI